FRAPVQIVRIGAAAMNAPHRLHDIWNELRQLPDAEGVALAHRRPAARRTRRNEIKYTSDLKLALQRHGSARNVGGQLRQIVRSLFPSLVIHDTVMASNREAMIKVAILPEPAGSGQVSYRAIAGRKQSVGKTAGQALDALTSSLPDEETGTLVIVQHQRPDQ